MHEPQLRFGRGTSGDWGLLGTRHVFPVGPEESEPESAVLPEVASGSAMGVAGDNEARRRNLGECIKCWSQITGASALDVTTSDKR